MENRIYKDLKNEENFFEQKNSIFAMSSKVSRFNPNAEPFCPRDYFTLTRSQQVPQQSRDLITVGPSQVPVNAKIWKTIASERVLPEVPAIPNQFPIPSALPPPTTSAGYNESYESQLYSNVQPAFPTDHNREVLVLRRPFGPVATEQGVELRLKFGVRILISLEGAVLLEFNGIRVGVSANNACTALEHPMGRVYQNPERVDVVAVDGTGKNNYIRYGKIWKDCVSLTSEGFALIYLVDTAGTRTTSDQVNRDWSRDYCKMVYSEGRSYRSQMETMMAADHYRYKTESDGTDVFFICNVRISQARDGLVRIQSDPLSIRASIENRSVTIKTPYMHCTASIGNSPHLFIRVNERRIHYDGTNFVARNMGHSSCFDASNYLRIN